MFGRSTSNPAITFYEALLSEGNVTLRSSDPLSRTEIAEAADLLTQFEQSEYRSRLANDPPNLDRESLLWATKMFYRAAQFLVFRELGPELLEKDISEQPPSPNSASSIYTVDQVFRFLPDLLRIAKAASSDDPLVKKLTSWAEQCPLSSVGIHGVECGDVSQIMQHTCLRSMYVDRILESEDVSRLDQSEVVEAVTNALGAFPDLCPKISAQLAVFTTRSTGEISRKDAKPQRKVADG